MSEMFTKCNGFIVSGDPLVYADSATMTGQGTVHDPFGVKSTDLFVQSPLYTGTSGNSAYIGWNNETVLFESTGKALKDTITLSESRQNFDSLRLLISCYIDSPCGYIDVPMYGSNLTSAFTIQNNSIPYSNASGAAYAINWMWNITATDTSMTLIKSRFWGKMNFDDANNGGTWQQGVNNNVPVVYKVIGVNRKA